MLVIKGIPSLWKSLPVLVEKSSGGSSYLLSLDVIIQQEVNI